MRSFFACVMKDVRLFFSRKAAVLVLVLPILLLAVLIPGFGETTSARTYVRPFSFVICDLDDSVMSRSLINQLRDFELFDQIASVREPGDSSEWFDRGYAAYATIPKGFFYAMYDMENLPVTIELNPGMPAESAILETVFRSVTDIVSTDQQARLAEFRLRSAEGFETDINEFYYESANYELQRALSRRNVFSDFRLVEDYTENSLKGAYATVTAMLCMLIPLCVLRGLPEELSLGIVDRLKCSGKGIYTLIISKYIAALILFALPFAAVSAAVRIRMPLTSYLSAIMLFTLSFSLFGAISISTPDSSRAQLTGNMLVILSLLFGGALYPYQMLPGIAQKTAYAFPVFHYLRGMNGADAGLWILSAEAAVLTAFFLYICRNPLKAGSRQKAGRTSAGEKNAGASLKSGRTDFLSMTWHKTLAMTGNRKMLILMLAVCLLCFSAADRILDEKASSEIVVAVADEDGSEISEEYIGALAKADGVTALRTGRKDAMQALERGKAESVLLIGEGFEKAFLSDEALPIEYRSASAGVAADAGREICAGLLLSLQSSYDAISRLVSEGVIAETEKDLFFDHLEEVAADARPIVAFSRASGGPSSEQTVFGRIYARYSGFAALIIFLFMLSLSVLLSGIPARAVRKAMSAVPRGYALFVLTDHLALVLAGMMMAAAAVLFRTGLNTRELLAYFLYINCVSGVCLLISLTRAGGGSDMTAAFLAMVTSTVGGCFFDLSSLGRFYSILSYFTPQGMLIGAVSGSALCLAVMAAVTAVCFAVYYASGKRAERA